MSQAAQARDSWADIPTRRPRREPDSWASPEELEVLGGLGEEPVADWTVLTLERDDVAREPDAPTSEPLVRLEDRHDAPPVATARRASGPAHPADAVTESMTALGSDSSRSRARGDVHAREPRSAGGHADRRTVVIRGHATPMRMDGGADRRRPAPRTRDRIGHRPDRVAMWAVMLGLLLIVVATMTAG